MFGCTLFKKISIPFYHPSYEVICVGSVSQDIFFPTDEGLIIDTPDDITSKQKVAFELGGKYRVENRYEAVGGVAANVTYGLTRLGHRAGCYSKCGQDMIGQWIFDAFKRERIPTDLLTADPDVASDVSAIIVLTRNGERTIFHNRDANERLEIIDRRFAHTQWVFMSSLNGDWQKNMRHILRLKNQYGFSIAFNPGQHNIKENPELIVEAIRQSAVLLLNKDEAIELIKSIQPDVPKHLLDDEQFLLNVLKKYGAGTIGMTDGVRGAWGYDGKAYWHCPIYTLGVVVDSTGAGDAFGSGFFSALLEGKRIEEALSYGIINSGSVVGSYGAIAGLLFQDMLQQQILNAHPQRLVVVEDRERTKE
ncbi:MAG: carbohydrate kinase family protein [Minisyncoccota bacterium]